MNRFQYAPGDPVQCLIIWAYGLPAHWFGGYRVVRDEGACVRVRDSDGAETLWARCGIRLHVTGPREAEPWERTLYGQPWHNPDDREARAA